MELNPAQRRAVQATGPVFVAAGAGSGKTRVLVERYVAAVQGRLLGHRVQPERILMVTFTEKAAAEMEARVRRRLLEEGETDAARRVQGAFISTIHGLCARLLRAEPFAAAIDPRFGVLDEAQASALAGEVMDEVLERFASSRGDEGLDFLNAYGPDAVAASARRVHAQMRAAGVEHPQIPAVRPADMAPLRAAVLQAASDVLACPCSGSIAQKNRLKAQGCLAALSSLGEGDSLLWVRDTFRPHRGPAAPQKEAAGRLADALDALAEGFATHLASRHHPLFESLLVAFDEAYSASKSAGGWLDFEDLELGARRLLRDHRGVRERYRRRFESIMVDEFQDTNRLQADVLAELDAGHSLTVGDHQQSIYGFRHADVALFDERRGHLAQAGTVVDLGVNYRSHPGVLGAINEACAAPCFFGSDAMRLEPDPNGPWPLDVAPRVELTLFAASAREARVLEPAKVAARIRRMLDEGEPVWDRGTQEFRPARLGDFAVLLRATTRVEAFETALASAGLDFYTESGRGYYAEREIAEACAYLRVLAQPEDDEALLTALRSPLAGLSLDALWLLRQEADRDGASPLWQAVERRAAAGLPPDDLAALDAFAGRTQAARARLGRVPLAQLLESAFSEAGYDLAVLLRGAGGARRWANLRKLMDLAMAYEELEGADPLGFVRFVESQTAIATREGAAPVAEEGIDAVRIMTIHAAKGLEFPIVFLADTGAGSAAGRDDVLWRPGVGPDPSVGARFAMKLRDLEDAGSSGYKTAAFERLAEERKDRDSEEERRCLYVAMTRAEQRLCVSGHLNWDKASDASANTDAELLAEAFGAQRGAREDDGRRGLRTGIGRAVARVELVRPGDEPGEERAGQSDAAGAGGSAGDVSAEGVRRVLAELAAASPPGSVAEPSPVIRQASFSTIATFGECRYRFLLESAAGSAEGPAAQTAGERKATGVSRSAASDGGPTMDPRAFGVAVHRLLERLDASEAAPGVDIVSAALAEQARAAGSEPDVSDDDVARARRLIEAFQAGPTAGRMREAVDAGGRLAREMPFAAAAAGTVVTGVLDAAVVPGDGSSSGEPLVVDYKTGRLGADDPEQLFEARYRAQAETYGWAVLAVGYPSVSVEFAFLAKPESPVRLRFTAADRPALEERVTAVLSAMASGPHPPLDGYDPAVCPGCPGLGGLCHIDRS